MSKEIKTFQKSYIFHLNISREYINVDENLRKQLWNPLVQFDKAKDVEKTKGYGFEEYHWYEHFKEGNESDVQYTSFKSEYLTMKFSCTFDFNNYPFDKHKCQLRFYEFRYPDEINIDITYIYFEDQYIDDRNDTIIIDVPKIPFRILITIGEDDVYNDTGVIFLSLERNELDLLIGAFYIPTGAFAVLSLVSYLISPELVST